MTIIFQILLIFIISSSSIIIVVLINIKTKIPYNDLKD